VNLGHLFTFVMFLSLAGLDQDVFIWGQLFWGGLVLLYLGHLVCSIKIAGNSKLGGTERFVPIVVMSIPV